MRIRVRRTGGFAGIERSAEVDTADPDLRSLAGEVLAGGSDTSRGVPDGFAYEITIDGTTIRCCDPRLTAAQRTLITRVLKEGA
ncbi:protealysin inhibitor emfourin [Streptomyces sp. NPDC055103]